MIDVVRGVALTTTTKFITSFQDLKATDLAEHANPACRTPLGALAEMQRRNPEFRDYEIVTVIEVNTDG